LKEITPPQGLSSKSFDTRRRLKSISNTTTGLKIFDYKLELYLHRIKSVEQQVTGILTVLRLIMNKRNRTLKFCLQKS
jgi:hypothetical protein